MPEQVIENHAATVRDSLSRNVVVDVGARVGYLVSRFFIPPFVLAHISLAAYGLWATAFILVSYVGISTMGISNVYIKYIAEYSARREYDKANRLLSTGLLLTIPTCLLIFALLWIGWPTVVNWLHIEASLRTDAKEVVLSVSAIFLASISLAAFRDVLVGVQKTASVQVVWIIGYLLETALIFGLLGLGRGIRGLAEAFLIRTAVEIGLQMIMTFRALPWLRISPALYSSESLKILLSFGGIVQLQSLLAIFLNSVERAAAAPLVGLSATGLLDIGKKLPAMAASIPSAFASSLVPAASYLHGGMEGTPEQRESVQKLYLKGARYMNLTAAYVCGLLAVIPLPLLDVWMGKRYAGAAYLMVIFSISTQVHLMTGPGTSILKGIGRPREEFYYGIPNLIALCLTLPAARLIEGKWTALGIGSAVALATLLSASFFLAHANKVLQISFSRYFRSVVVPGIVPYAVALVFAYPVTVAVEHSTRWVGAAWLVLAGTLYTLILAAVVDFLVWEKGERLWFHAVIGQKLARFRPAPSL